MTATIMRVDTRPLMFYFVTDQGKESDYFFMGEIPSKIKFIESLGFEVLNKEMN